MEKLTVCCYHFLVREDASGCHSVFSKTKAKGKAAVAKKARLSEDSEEEQKMDMDEENDILNVVLVEEIKQEEAC